MAEGRGTSNAPNTRNPGHPASKPSRLDQFADDLFNNEPVNELEAQCRPDIKLPETMQEDPDSAKETGRRS